MIPDAHATLITFELDATIQLWEQRVVPPGLTAGGGIGSSTMRNGAWKTAAPRTTKGAIGLSMVCLYDPAAYDRVAAMLGRIQSITTTFNDGTMCIVWGWLEAFTPARCAVGELSTAAVTILVANMDTEQTEKSPVYVIAAPVITDEPDSQSVSYGASIILSVTATGGGLSYQWYQGTSGDTSSPIAGETGSTMQRTITATLSFWVRVSNALGQSDSATAVATMTSVLGPSTATAWSGPQAEPYTVDKAAIAKVTMQWDHALGKWTVFWWTYRYWLTYPTVWVSSVTIYRADSASGPWTTATHFIYSMTIQGTNELPGNTPGYDIAFDNSPMLIDNTHGKYYRAKARAYKGTGSEVMETWTDVLSF